MISEWEEQQEELIRAAALPPELDDKLRTTILLEAGSAVRRRSMYRKLAVAASLMMFLGGSSWLAHHWLNPQQGFAESQATPPPGDGSVNDQIDEIEKRSRGPIQGGTLSFPKFTK